MQINQLMYQSPESLFNPLMTLSLTNCRHHYKDRTDLQVVESVELHEVMQSGEGLVGVLEVKGGEW